MQCGRVWARRILKSEDTVEVASLKERECLCEVGLGLAGKADDYIGGDADIAARRLHPGDALHVLLTGVETLHGVEHAGGAALHGKMDVIAQRGQCVDRVDNVAAKVARV